jgi:very-short-patch-repair endonuclease
MSKKRYNKNNIKRMRKKLRDGQDLPPMNRKNRPMSNLEQMVADILDGLKVEYEREKPLKYINGYRYYDFCLFEHGILIEVDGEYWHAKRGKPSYTILMAKKNDYVKNWLAKKEGYSLIRIKESQLKEEHSLIGEIISEEIKKNLKKLS